MWQSDNSYNIMDVGIYIQASKWLGRALISPTLARISLTLHFTIINNRKQMPNLIRCCPIQKYSVVSKIYHIWSMDHQFHGKHVTKFSWIATYGHRAVVLRRVCSTVLLNGHGRLMTNDGKYHRNTANFCYINSLISNKLQGDAPASCG